MKNCRRRASALKRGGFIDMKSPGVTEHGLFFLLQDSGVVILKNDIEDEDEGVDEEESDSDSGLGGSVPPCSVTFIGANVSTGKSSMRSKPRDKKVRINYPLGWIKYLTGFGLIC